MPLKLLAGASVNCVSVDDMKLFLRLSTTSTAEDALLTAWIKVAEDYAENYTKRALMRQQWEFRLDSFPGEDGEIELPRPPLSTASTDLVISYVEDTTVGNTTSVASTAYTIDYYSEPGKVYPSYDNEWPDTFRDERNAVRITYFSGVTVATAVPETIRQWIKLRVGAMYEHREALMAGNWANQTVELPRNFVDGLLDAYVMMEQP